jgi:arginase
MGRGPLDYMKAGAARRLRNRGWHVELAVVKRPVRSVSDRLTSIVAVNRSLAEKVKSAIKRGSIPVVLGGDCNSCLGALAGLQMPKVGVIWFDAHGDFQTPETSPSGYFDGMPLAIVTGRCFQGLRRQIGQKDPIPESLILHIGGRAMGRNERARFERSDIQVVWASDVKSRGIGQAVSARLRALRSRIRSVYLHVDIDVLDPKYARGVDFPTNGGLSPNDIVQAVHRVANQFQVRAVALTAYNPTRDSRAQTLQTGLALIEAISDELGQQIRSPRLMSTMKSEQ